MNPKTINTENLNLEGIMEHINNHYDGNILFLIAQLEHANYMLHYLPNESFSEQEVRNVAYTLKGLKECFLKAHLQQQEWDYKTLA